MCNYENVAYTNVPLLPWSDGRCPIKYILSTSIPHYIQPVVT